ncbi:hypothetical protein [Klebsiella quasipneumoniae]|uniref:hypothetical protein n=1 Tax=Klebsiella quasipneumoniae TaxID=1463165 RepID=UPI0029651063|nr:hypothetical protein [Klebsiella quasipneumoniae]
MKRTPSTLNVWTCLTRIWTSVRRNDLGVLKYSEEHDGEKYVADISNFSYCGYGVGILRHSWMMAWSNGRYGGIKQPAILMMKD